MAMEFGDYDPAARTLGFSAGSLIQSLLARGQGPATTWPGLDFDHGAGWWEFAFYVGPLGLLVMSTAFVAWRRTWPLLLIGLFYLALALEGTSLWSLLVDLPVWRTQRSPSRFVEVVFFVFLAAAGPGLQWLYGWGRERKPKLAMGLVVLLALGLGGDLFVQSLPWQRGAVGSEFEAKEHRPQPLEFASGTGAQARLHVFSPNRLVYRVEAQTAGRVVFPIRHSKGGKARWKQGGASSGSEWLVRGLGPAPWVGQAGLGKDGKLALDFEAGQWEVEFRYRPRFFSTGLWVSLASVLALAGMTRSQLRRSRAEASA